MSDHKFLNVSVSKKTGRTYINFISPLGKASWPKLVTPDDFRGKKSWKTKLIVPGDEAQEFIDELQPFLDEYHASQIAYAEEQCAVVEDPKKLAEWKKKLRDYKTKWTIKEIGEEELNDNAEPTGNIVFSFGRNYINAKSGEVLSPPELVDAFENPVQIDDVWSGSMMRIGGFVFPYTNDSNKTFGLSLKMAAVQITKLVTKGSAGGNVTRFGAVEGGFNADAMSGEAQPRSTTDEDTGSHEDDGDEDF